MSLALDIALSHLTHRRRQTLVSLIGVALGVTFFIGISSMMQGFQRDFINRVIDVSPHITIKDEFRDPPRQAAEMAYPAGAVIIEGLKPRDEVRGIRNARAIMDSLQQMDGVKLAPTFSGSVLIRYGAKDVSANVIGIDPQAERRVTKLEEDLVQGSLDDLYSVPNAIILGSGVARKAGVAVGDTVSVISPVGVVMKMTVAGIFDSGVVAVDNSETYTLLKKAQILQDRPNVINRIRLRLDDVERAGDLAKRIEGRFGYRTEPWQEASKNVLGIFVIQNAIMYSTVGTILVVACFGIFNVISTVVFEKTRDIAILKSMGFAEGDIKRIFVLEGLMVGIVGTLIGWGMGYGLVEFMGSLRFPMEGFVKAQGFILYKSPRHYLISGGFAIAASVLAAYIPARRAAGVNPVDIVRGGG